MELRLAGDQSLAVFLRAQFLGQFSSTHLSTSWMEELNAPLASLLMIPTWELLLTLLRDKRPCGGF